MVICGFEACVYTVQSEILCGRGKGHSLCVLVVMKTVSLGEDYILKVVSGAGLTRKLLCTLGVLLNLGGLALTQRSRLCLP